MRKPGGKMQNLVLELLGKPDVLSALDGQFFLTADVLVSIFHQKRVISRRDSIAVNR